MQRHDGVETANDRFKRRFGNDFWYSVAVAAAFHMVLFAFWPEMTVADLRIGGNEIATIDLPPDVDVPKTPEQIVRPAQPVIADGVDPQLDVPWAKWPDVDRLPPPPSAAPRDDTDRRLPQFTPMTVRPQLQNTAEVERILTRHYPPMLRDAGVGGTPILWFFIDENGRVLETRVRTSSGYTALDEAAQKVAEHMRFSPAWNRDRKVPVWVEIPLVFRTR